MSTILIVDDSQLVRHAVRSCIEGNTDWAVCGEAENGRVAIEKVIRLRPDVVLLDLTMPVMNGLEAARHITRISPQTIILMFTLNGSEQLQKDALAVGVKKVLSKSEKLAEMLLSSLRALPPRPSLGSV